jgi:hypothetical protein
LEVFRFQHPVAQYPRNKKKEVALDCGLKCVFEQKLVFALHRRNKMNVA